MTNQIWYRPTRAPVDLGMAGSAAGSGGGVLSGGLRGLRGLRDLAVRRLDLWRRGRVWKNLPLVGVDIDRRRGRRRGTACECTRSHGRWHDASGFSRLVTILHPCAKSRVPLSSQPSRHHHRSPLRAHLRPPRNVLQATRPIRIKHPSGPWRHLHLHLRSVL